MERIKNFIDRQLEKGLLLEKASGNESEVMYDVWGLPVEDEQNVISIEYTRKEHQSDTIINKDGISGSIWTELRTLKTK